MATKELGIHVVCVLEYWYTAVYQYSKTHTTAVHCTDECNNHGLKHLTNLTLQLGLDESLGLNSVHPGKKNTFWTQFYGVLTAIVEN